VSGEWDGEWYGEWNGAWNTEVDGLESRLAEFEKMISRARAEQVEILTRLDALQVDVGDGDRGMEDWTAARLDVSRQTAHRLLTVTHAFDPWHLRQLQTGRWGLDRAGFLVKLAATGAPAALITAGSKSTTSNNVTKVVTTSPQT